MLQVFIIVFREILEITVILGLVLVATHGIKDRGKWIVSGIALGIIGSAIIAISTSAISDAFEGLGQEYFNAILLVVIAILLAWTVIWMKSHGQKLSQEIKQIGKQAQSGEVSLLTLMLVVASTILREGAEIVLFTYGSYKASNLNLLGLMGGSLAGLALGLIAGGAIYFGLIRFSGRRVFQATSVLLSLVAAGMAAQAVNFLSASGLIVLYSTPLWDSSSAISDGSVTGQILAILIGYSSKPSAIQLVVYCMTLAVIWLIVRRQRVS